ncbi:MAG: hypothetical protein K2J37_03440 [Ruminococcus sp.]|nr:hypothetical protein [Ruminococcus sp.]MDE6785135.1 hypothetical protein [Ruminococcus sp.]
MRKITSFIFALTVVSAVFTGCGDFGYELYDNANEWSYEEHYESTTEAPSETEIPSEIAEISSDEEIPEETAAFNDYDDDTYVEYYFRTESQLDQHFDKHGGEFEEEFGYDTAEDYEKGASDVINNPDALYKTEAEDGDGVYYLEDTNEFVILSTDGYIRTYFRPTAGIDYFNRQ